MTDKKFYQLKLKDGRVFRLPRDSTAPKNILAQLMDMNWQRNYAVAGDPYFFVIIHTKGEMIVNIDQIAWLEMPDGTLADVEKAIEEDRKKREDEAKEEERRIMEELKNNTTPTEGTKND